MAEYQYKVSDFEGPLDLLLYLIEKNKVDIYNIPIVKITDQFNEYVRHIETFDVNYASKFFVMAATLLQIKSRLLLPKPPKTETEEDPQDELVRQLVEYKQMKEAAAVVTELWEKRALMDSRERTPVAFEKHFSGTIDKTALYEAFHTVSRILEKKVTPEIHLQQEIYSVSECMQQIERLIKQSRRPIPVRQVFLSCRNRSELVVVFLAILELLKIGHYHMVTEGEDEDAVALQQRK